MNALPGDIISEYVGGDVDNYDSELNERQREQHEYTESLVEKFGKFDQGSLSDGAHYAPESPFEEDGLICSSCVFFIGGHGCEVVDGNIEPEGICKLWIIPETLVGISKGRSNIMGPLMRNASHMHHTRLAAEAEAGKRYYADYHANSKYRSPGFLTGSNMASTNLRKPERPVKRKKKDHPIIAAHKRRRKGQKAVKNSIRNALRSRGAR